MQTLHIKAWEADRHLVTTWRDGPGGPHELPLDIRLVKRRTAIFDNFARSIPAGPKDFITLTIFRDISAIISELLNEKRPYQFPRGGTQSPT